MHTDADGLYAILRVDPAASEQVIHAAFRRRAKELHPDVSPDSVPEFIALKAAYDALSDPSARATYDRACSIAHEAAAPPPPLWEPPPARAHRSPSTIARYSFAFAFMSAIAFLFVGVLITLTDAPPASPIAQSAFGEGGPPAKRGGTAERGSESPDAGERADGGARAASEGPRQAPTLFFWEEPQARARQRPSGFAAPDRSW